MLFGSRHAIVETCFHPVERPPNGIDGRKVDGVTVDELEGVDVSSTAVKITCIDIGCLSEFQLVGTILFSALSQ